METIGLLNLHRAEMVQKYGREMSAVLSICFQEPPVFKIKKKNLYPPSLGVELEDSNRFIVSMPVWVMKSAHELETHMPNVPRDINLSQLPTFKNGNILHSSLDS